MKKAALIYFSLSLILYFVGLSPFGRNYIKEDYGVRNDTFDPTQKYWISGHTVYSEGKLNSRASDHLPRETKFVYMAIDLRTATPKKQFTEILPSTDITTLPLVRVDYGSDTRETISSRPADIYAVFANTSCTSFIVDAKDKKEPHIHSLYWTSTFYRTPIAESTLWLVMPLAHVLDLATAPFQAVVVIAISLFTPKWN